MLTWVSIATVSALAIAGEVLIAGAMQKLGDLDIIRERSGLAGAIRAVLSSPLFLTGAFCMALNFFAELRASRMLETQSPRRPSCTRTWTSGAGWL